MEVENAPLCAECALCCDGSLFDSGELLAEDLAAMPARTLVRLRVSSSERFPQPCGALEGQMCVEYATRPSTCRNFVCILLDRLREGKTTDAEARATVAEMRAVLATLRATLGLAPGESIARAFRERPAPSDPLTLLSIAGYERLKEKHFKPRA